MVFHSSMTTIVALDLGKFKSVLPFQCSGRKGSPRDGRIDADESAEALHQGSDFDSRPARNTRLQCVD